MSAHILLSMIAPEPSAAPQGSANDVAGEFEALLAGIAGDATDVGKTATAPVAESDESIPPETAAFGRPAPAPSPVALAASPLLMTPLPQTDAAATAEEQTDAALAAPADAVPAAPGARAGEAGSQPLPVADAAAPAEAPVAATASGPATVPAEAPLAPDPAPKAASPSVEAPAQPATPPRPQPVSAALTVSASTPDGEAALPPAPMPAAAAPDMARLPTPAAAPAAAALPTPAAVVAHPPPLTPLRPMEGNAASSRTAASGSAASDRSDLRTAERPASDPTPAPARQSTDAPPAPARRPDGPAEASPHLPAAAAAGDEGQSVPGVGNDAGSAPESPAALREASSPTPLVSRVAVEATAQIAAQILRKLDSRSTRFEMALLPEELGRVDVKLDIDADGRLAARLAFDNPAAAADLRGRADELRRQLEQAGFHLADDAFEFAERDSGSSAFDRGDDARQGSGRAFSAAARLHALADAVPVARWTSLSLTPAGVDLKV